MDGRAPKRTPLHDAFVVEIPRPGCLPGMRASRVPDRQKTEKNAKETKQPPGVKGGGDWPCRVEEGRWTGTDWQPVVSLLPQLPRSPSLHAVLTTPVDRTGACRFLPCPRGLPRLTGGSASTTSLSRPAQASLTLRPARSLARLKSGLLPEASIRPVTRPARSVATMSYRHLHGWIPPPQVISAVSAHC